MSAREGEMKLRTIIGLGALACSGGAWGAEELAAVELGDFDCSGRLDEARLYGDDEGELRVEIAFDVPEEEQSKPHSSTLKSAWIEVDDLDGDKCEDLIVTADEQTQAFQSTDRGWQFEDALHGAGDV